jgi:hypothetical protein
MTDPRINKSKNDWQSWKNKPYAASRSDEARRRAELWESFNTYCREGGGGWIISPPGARIATLETPKDSDLPERLAKLGYEVNRLPGDHSRLTGGAPSPEAQRLKRLGHAITEPCAGPIMEVLRFSVELPWAAPPPPPIRRRA